MMLKFKNGILLTTTYDKLIVDGKISDNQKFFKNAKEIVAINQYTRPSKAILTADTDYILKSTISLEEYYALPERIKSLYTTISEKVEEEQEDIKVYELNFDYLGEPPANAYYMKFEDSSLNSDVKSILKFYTPATIKGKDLQEVLANELRKLGATDDILEGGSVYEARYAVDYVVLRKYETMYNNEFQRVEVKKSNGMSYAQPRYRRARKRPNLLWERTLTVPYNFTLKGHNAFDLDLQIKEIARQLMSA